MLSCARLISLVSPLSSDPIQIHRSQVHAATSIIFDQVFSFKHWFSSPIHQFIFYRHMIWCDSISMINRYVSEAWKITHDWTTCLVELFNF